MNSITRLWWPCILPKFTFQSAHTKRSSQLSTTNVPLNYREMVQSFCPFYLCWWRSENGKRGWSSELCVTDFNEHSKYGITANWSPNIIVSWLNWHLSLKMKSCLHIVTLPRCCYIALTVLNIKKMGVTENWSCIALVEVTGHCKWKVGSRIHIVHLPTCCYSSVLLVPTNWALVDILAEPYNNRTTF